MFNQTALKRERVLEREFDVNKAIVISNCCTSVTNILKDFKILVTMYNLQSTLTVH